MSLDISFKIVKPLYIELQPENSPYTEIIFETVYEDNITHNLIHMAAKAGLYEVIWHSDMVWCGQAKAGYMIPYLEAGISLMLADPARFRAFDAKNGWGTY